MIRTTTDPIISYRNGRSLSPPDPGDRSNPGGAARRGVGRGMLARRPNVDAGQGPAGARLLAEILA